MPDYEDHGRRSVRLPGCDYALPGAYFVTICAYKPSRIFGAIDKTEFTPSNFSNAATIEWFRTAERRENALLFEDEFIFMPNHLPGIIRIDHQSTAVGAGRRLPLQTMRLAHRAKAPLGDCSILLIGCNPAGESNPLYAWHPGLAV
ncbi:MAG: hypothetical protein ACK2T2_13155 [Anaerolineales bacterium]